MIFVIFFFYILSWTNMYCSVVKGQETSASNYPKVARWGPSGLELSSSSQGTNGKEQQNTSPWNHRSDDNSRKLGYVTKNNGVTYYFSKDIPRVDENVDSLPGPGEVMQDASNHKSFYDYIYKPQGLNSKADTVSDQIKPPSVVYGSADYSSYSDFQKDSKSSSNLYNSPYTSYNPPKQNPSSSQDDFIQYPPIGDSTSSSQSQNVYPKVPLTELYSPANLPSASGSDTDSDQPEPTVDSYQTPKPPKGSKPKPPLPVYGAPLPPPSVSPNQKPSEKSKKKSKPSTSEPNVYNFPEPFPVPQIYETNYPSPPAASYGEPVKDDYLDNTSIKNSKGPNKKKPSKQVQSYTPPTDADLDSDVDMSHNGGKKKYPSAPRPFHPPLSIPEDDSDNDDDDDEDKGPYGSKHSFLAPPPVDDDSSDDNDDDEGPPPEYFHKPSKQKSRKPSYDKKPKNPPPADTSSEMDMDSRYPPPPMDTDSKHPPPPPPMDMDSSYPPHDHSMDDIKYPPPAAGDMTKYPSHGHSMAEDDLSPPPNDEHEHGHQFNYEPYDYDHHVYHEVKHTTPAPQDHRANYSYYFLGRKLWYVPLYFCIYFIVYVTILIIKAIARHKVQFVNNFDVTTSSSRMARHLEDMNNVYNNISSTIESFDKKYM